MRQIRSAWWYPGVVLALGLVAAGCLQPREEAAEPAVRLATETVPEAQAGEALHEEGTLEEPIFVDQHGGRTWNIFGLQIVGKVMGEETGGKYSVVVSTTPPGGGPPLHVHEGHDEMFYVVEGTFEFRSGDRTARASQGAVVVLPRGLPHSFRNLGKEPGILMNTITPGGFEQFFEEIDRLPKDRPLDRDTVASIAAGYGLRFLPPETGR